MSTAANNTFYGATKDCATTLHAKLFVYGQHVYNCNFAVIIGTAPQKKILTLKKLCILGSVLAILLFNIYIEDLIIRTTIATKFAYAEASRWLNLTDEGGIHSFMYKTNKSWYVAGQILPFWRHLELLHLKLILRLRLVRRLAKWSWESVKKSYAQQPWALAHCTAEYCHPVWCRRNRTPFIDKPINDPLRMVTGCLRLILTNSQSVLAEKKRKADLRQKRATIALARLIKEPNHLLQQILISAHRTVKSF